MSRFVTSATEVRGNVWPEVVDTESGVYARFVPDYDVARVAEQLNSGEKPPAIYAWRHISDDTSAPAPQASSGKGSS